MPAQALYSLSHRSRFISVLTGAILIAGLQATSATLAADQTVPGAGNATATALGERSPLVQSAHRFLITNARQIRDPLLRRQTLDAIQNRGTCVAHRAGLSHSDQQAILQKLKVEGLVSTADDASFPGGLQAGVFPPIINDGSACPTLPQPLTAAPGSSFGGHHSQPGGLVVHEALNDLSSLSLRDNYQAVYNTTGADGLPVIRDLVRGEHEHQDNAGDDHNRAMAQDGFRIDRDLMITAPLWHDWAKTIVFQWNADGTEFKELNFGGNGQTDNYGAAGDSRTGGHHILGIAETMARGLSPEFVITQASAHSAPSLGNEYKVVNWLRAAAIIARIDPVAKGYLSYDRSGTLRLPAVRRLGEADLNSSTPTQSNLLVEYILHNLSDADFTFTGPAVHDVELLLAKLAPEYGYNASDAATFNNRFRNPALSLLSAERLYIIFSNEGLNGVRREINKLRKLAIL